jgi:hypothetical protein
VTDADDCARRTQDSALSPACRVASSQLMLSPRPTWGSSSVSSMAYQAPLPLRACSKPWARHLCVYNRTQYRIAGNVDLYLCIASRARQVGLRIGITCCSFFAT